jgi:hypothetical protein
MTRFAHARGSTRALTTASMRTTVEVLTGGHLHAIRTFPGSERAFGEQVVFARIDRLVAGQADAAVLRWIEPWVSSAGQLSCRIGTCVSSDLAIARLVVTVALAGIAVVGSTVACIGAGGTCSIALLVTVVTTGQ